MRTLSNTMDAKGIPLPEEAIIHSLKDLEKRKPIKTESEDNDSKKSKRKSEKARELSAAEKFNQFKKQRTEKKGEGDIVDDLFKDFIAKKMKEIDAERGQDSDKKSKGAKSVSDFNKILDKELKSISGASQTAISETSDSSNFVKTEKNVIQPEIPLPGKSSVVVTVKQEPEDNFQGPSLPPLKIKKDSEDVEDIVLPVSEPVKSEPKKTTIGFKNFGIKLSLTSTELIKSGDVHKNGKRLEEGEVMSSHSDASSSSSENNDDGDDGEVSGTGSISDSEGKDKSKKKKKKKLKHKKKKKHKDKGKDGGKESGVLVVKEEKNSSKRKVSITPKSRSKSPKKYKRSRSRSRSKDRRKRSKSKERRRSRSHSRSRTRSKHRRSRSRSKHRRSRSTSRSKHRRSRSGSRLRRRRSRSRSRSRRDRSPRRSPSPERFWRSKYGHFDAFQYMRDKGRHGRSRSRSRSPDKESDRFIAKEKKRLEDLRLKIDKAKLREIAIKNAVEMAKSGTGPNVDVVYKAGGKSVEELTDFCKRISNKHPKPFPEDSSSDEETTQRPASDDEDLIHHPFKVKEAPIVMDIRNAKQLPVVSPADRLAKSGELRLQFPVSSGSQHRQKEWVPVEKPEPVKTFKTPAPPTGVLPPTATQTTAPEDKVFEEAPQEPVDISSIISERLSAVRKLQENPHDLGAKLVLDQAQKKASQWANSRMLPGAFIGSTGANVMSQEELIGPDKRRQAWLKKDVFTSAAPVKSGIGMLLLQKMGWNHGQGLGKNNEGSVEPLQLDVKVDRKGLLTTGEGKKGGGSQAPKLPPIRDLSGKHPVSALVELCNKRKWGPPQFEFIFECGPDHKKNFLCKVKVNGTEYQPSIASNNKKLAKANAATVCLQTFGLVPRDGPI